MRQTFVFIDYQNQPVDLGLLLANISEDRRILGVRAYGYWARQGAMALAYSRQGAELIELPEDSFSSNKRNDVKLIVDAIETMFTKPDIEEFVIVAGDLDFLALLLKLREYGKYVTVVSRKKSASSYLVRFADDFIAYDDLVKSEILPQKQPGSLEDLADEVRSVIAERDEDIDQCKVVKILRSVGVRPGKYASSSVEDLAGKIINSLKKADYMSAYAKYILRTVAKYGVKGIVISELVEFLNERQPWSPPTIISLETFLEKMVETGKLSRSGDRVRLEAPQRWEELLRDRKPYPDYIDKFCTEFLLRCDSKKTIREILDEISELMGIQRKIVNALGYAAKFTGLLKGSDGSDYVSFNIPVTCSSFPNDLKREIFKVTIKNILKSQGIQRSEIEKLSKYLSGSKDIRIAGILLEELVQSGEVTLEKEEYVYTNSEIEEKAGI